MGSGKVNDESSLFSPLNECDGLSLTIRESGDSDSLAFTDSFAAEVMSFPYVSSPNPSWENVHGAYQSHFQGPSMGNNSAGFMRLGTTQNELSSIELRGSLRNQAINSSGFQQNTRAPMKFMPIQSSMAGGYQIIRQEVEAKRFHGIPSAPMSECRRETGVGDDVKFSAFHPGAIDGSFLTLGIGNDADFKNKTKFSHREVASKLEETFAKSSISQVPQTVSDFSSQSYNSARNFAGLYSNSGCYPGPMGNLEWRSSKGDGRTVQCSTAGLTSNSFQSCGIPETIKQYDFCENDNKNLCFGGASDGRKLALDSFNGCHSNPPSSLPYRSSNTSFSNPGYPKRSQLESVQPVQAASHPTMGQMQNYLTRNDQHAFPSFASNPTMLQGSSITQDYIGLLPPQMGGHIPQSLKSGSSVCVQPVGPLSSRLGVNSAPPLVNNTYPGKIRPQIAQYCSINTATGGPFPRRLGVQPDEPPAQSANEGNGPPPRNFNPVQPVQNLLGSPSVLGHPQVGLLPGGNVQRLPCSTGQVLPVPKVWKSPQISNISSQHSLKRRPSANYPVPPGGHRRRIVHLPNNHHSMIYPKQGIPAPPSSHDFYIKWQGFDQPPQPSGRKCLLCKRDLSFAPDGPIHQPTNAPAVAVLHCGHTFHDHCLQLITPEDQAKDPPCIPCAIGET